MYSDLKDVAMVVLAVGLAVGGMLVVRGKVRCSMSLAQRNLFSTNYCFFSTLYTFFLGFAVISLWQDYNRAAATVTDEADLLVVEYRLSLALDDADAFRQSLVRYVDFLRTTGWEKMEHDEPSDGAQTLYDDIWDNLRRIKPKRAEDHGLYDIMVNRLISLNKLRHLRQLLIDGNLYPPIWIIIYIGVAFMIVGFYFIETGHGPADIYFMCMMLTMVLGNIFLLYELDTPFSGIIRLDKGTFEAAAQAMRVLGSG